MSVRRGVFARVVDRLRGGPTPRKPQGVERGPQFVERGPREHGDDGYLHASGRVDVEHDHRAGAPEELDRGFGERASNDAVNSER